MVIDKMAAIGLDFKWMGFRISDSTQNPDHLQLTLFLTIQNLDKSVFQIPTVSSNCLSQRWNRASTNIKGVYQEGTKNLKSQTLRTPRKKHDIEH